MDMGSKNNFIFKHESFAYWEQTIKGILIQKSKDFITLSKNGLNLLALGKSDKRKFQNNIGKDLMIHSLESYNFLKCDKENCIFFQCQIDEK